MSTVLSISLIELNPNTSANAVSSS